MRLASRSRLIAALVALTTGAALLALPSTPAQAAVSLSWHRMSSGFSQPVHVTSPRDGTGRLFVVEKSGRIKIWQNGRIRARAFLNIRNRVRDAGEGGLLSVAFHPQWTQHPYIWVAYTNNGGDLQVSRLRASSYRANRISVSTLRRVLVVHHPDSTTNHYAGQLAFGPGNLLYLSTGDGGGSGDPGNQAQNKNSLQGKILRFQVVGAQASCGRRYCVPASNPFAGPRRGNGLIWALGLRNAWRFSIDPRNGNLWIGDVGEQRREEVDRIKAGDGGENLGWSCMEGRLVFNQSRCVSGRRYHGPRWTYGDGRGESIVGGFVYRGQKYRSFLGGHYVAGDFISGNTFRSAGGRLLNSGSLPLVTSFGEGSNREIYAVTINGGLYRMVARRS